MPELPVNSIQMHYEHHSSPGNDKHYPLLMLSGMASDSASWQPVQQALASQYELIIPDNRCTGRTLPNPVETSRELMARDILALLDELKIEKVNVLGHSMGAMLGWALAAEQPARINRLISASALPWVIPARVSLFDSLSVLRTQSNEEHWFALLYQFLFSPAFFENPSAVEQAVKASMAYPYKQSTQSFATQCAALSSFIPEVDINKVVCDVSILTGENDLLMTPLLLENFCNKHHYPFTILANAAHAIHWEQPDAFIHYVIDELNT